MPIEASRARRQLAAELAHLRALSGLALRPFGAASGLAHARVRRIERLDVLPSAAEVGRWLQAAGVDGTDPDRRSRVLALVEAAHVETSPWADLLASSDHRHLNTIAAAREHGATHNFSYQQFIVPGLAQTSAYARALLQHLRVAIDPAADLPARMARQEVLHQPGREFRFVVTQRAWCWNPDPMTVSMIGQQDRLRELDRLPAVSVRLLEDEALPMGGYSSFTVYDGNDGALVGIELEHHAITITDPTDVERYRTRFSELFDAAVALPESRAARDDV